jgi:hypothetical protein
VAPSDECAIAFVRQMPEPDRRDRCSPNVHTDRIAP